MENLTLWYHQKTEGFTLWYHQNLEGLMLWYHQKIEEAQFYRVGVLAFTLLIQANLIVPATLLAISMNGGSSSEFVTCAVLSFVVLVSQLAVMPAKVTIPLFIISTFVHGLIIVANIV